MDRTHQFQTMESSLTKVSTHLICLAIFYLLLNPPTHGDGASKRPATSSGGQRIDPVTRDWMNLTEYWCFPDNLPEATIDDVYECFRAYKGNKEFEAQIRCENELLPLNMTKNDVRRKLCKNDKKSVGQFEKCFAKHGVAVQKASSSRSAVQAKPSRSVMNKFKELVSCMKKALKWHELNQAGQGGPPAAPPPPSAPSN